MFKSFVVASVALIAATNAVKMQSKTQVAVASAAQVEAGAEFGMPSLSSVKNKVSGAASSIKRNGSRMSNAARRKARRAYLAAKRSGAGQSMMKKAEQELEKSGDIKSAMIKAAGDTQTELIKKAATGDLDAQALVSGIQDFKDGHDTTSLIKDFKSGDLMEELAAKAPAFEESSKMLNAQLADVSNLESIVDNGVQHILDDEATMNSLATEFANNEIAQDAVTQMVRDNSHFAVDILNDNEEAVQQLMSLDPAFAEKFEEFSQADIEKMIQENPE